MKQKSTYTFGGALHGKGRSPSTEDDEVGSEHPMHDGGSHFGGDGEDMGHLGSIPSMHETEGKIAALKAIGDASRKHMAMHLRERMPKAPAPEHDTEGAEGGDGSGSATKHILDDSDAAHAERLRRIMAGKKL